MTASIAIALSGGIDSLVSAALLKEQGHRVIGLHFITGYEDGGEHEFAQSAEAKQEGIKSYCRRIVDPLAQQLDIPIHLIDLHEEFQKHVVDYFVRAYTAGKTPNPCLVCNPTIKFDELFRQARSLGADYISTGHYARINGHADGRFRLLRGADERKDQSYFLARLNQRQLSSAILPLGYFKKAETRRMARKMGLIPACARESQDICFIKNGRYGDFVARQTGFYPAPGPIEDIHGRRIGEHKGLHHFTVGQRRGINCPAAEPYYVVRLEPERKCLVVGGVQDLLATGCRVSAINWIVPPAHNHLKVLTRIRYRHQAVPSQLTLVDPATAEITFEQPQSAVTPGQGAVFYHHDEVLGAGWIE